MIGIWCEWDVGQENTVFKTEESAMKWLETNPYILEILEEEDSEEKTIKDLIDDGLIFFNKITVIE